MLFCLASLAWIDSLEQSGEAPVDCDAFVGSTDVSPDCSDESIKASDAKQNNIEA